MVGMKIFRVSSSNTKSSSSSSRGGSRRSSTGASMTYVPDDDHLDRKELEERYNKLKEEHRRLRQITGRIATKIGIIRKKNKKQQDNNKSLHPDEQHQQHHSHDYEEEDDGCPPPHEILAQAHRLQKLNELVVALSQVPRVAGAYKIVAQYTREIVGAARVSIAVLVQDETTGEEFLEVFGLDGSEGTIPMGIKLPLDGTQIGTVVRTRQPVRVMDTKTSEYLDCQHLSQMGVQACVDVPLISSGKVLGTLNTGVTDRAVYYPEVEQLLLQISSVLASAMEKERLLEEAVAARNQNQVADMKKKNGNGGECETECSQCRNKRLLAQTMGGLPPRSISE